MMYTVIWDNQEGIQQDRQFECIEDARLEAADLEEKHVGVKILDENDNVIEW